MYDIRYVFWVVLGVIVGAVVIVKLLDFIIEIVQWQIYVHKHIRNALRTFRRAKGAEYVYFYSSKSPITRYVKIGKTSNYPLDRLRAQRTAMPQGIKVWGIIAVKDCGRAEQFLHHLFADDRLSKDNEWFRMSARLWILMRTLRHRDLTEEIQRLLDNGRYYDD